MAEVTDLHVLAKMSKGTPNEDDAFIVRDENGTILYKIHSLQKLVDILSKVSPSDIFPSLCRIEDNEEIECDVALWIHYVLGDAVLSAKIFNLANEFKDNPERLKIETFNLCFNRYLNFQELLEFSDEIMPFEEKSLPTNL
ncbi:MAG TPA: hypothetical protein VMX55_10230 [candidate division Zixibacteria bacterium]|nr:hypothetical protein [candidate division Zixibacteria bacterium]